MIGDGSHSIPLSRVWVDYDAGTSASTEVVFTRLVTTSFAPLAVSPEFEWEISTTRTGYGSAEVTFKGLGVAGETDWQVLILTTDDGGASWYVSPSQVVNSLLHEITLPDQIFPRRYALITASDLATPEVVDAIFNDEDDDGVAEAGEILTLIFDRGVIARPAQLSQSSFSLPVSGDSLGGAGFAVASNPQNSRFVDITLGASPTLTIPGAFNASNTSPGDPSGIDIASGLPPAAITSLAGRPAAPSGAKDIDFTVVTNSGVVGAGGGTVSVLASPDAAYSQHEIDIPSGALGGATTFTLQPPPEAGGQLNALQIVSNPPGVTFTVPATLTLEYRDSDIDTERGQLEAAMLVHQLVGDGMGSYTYTVLPGTQTVNTGANTVSVDIGNLNPQSSSDEVGIFATLPGETIDRVTYPIKPEGTGGPVILSTGSLSVGPDGHYTLHQLEIPSYQLTTGSDPDRTDLTLRTATAIERIALTGGQSFPLASGALLVIETHDADDNPVAFTAPMTLSVQFFDGSINASDDLLDFSGTPSSPDHMFLVCDMIDGPQVDFQFIGRWGDHFQHSVAGTCWVQCSDIVNLTGPSGLGVWGAVSNPAIPVELSVFGVE